MVDLTTPSITPAEITTSTWSTTTSSTVGLACRGAPQIPGGGGGALLGCAGLLAGSSCELRCAEGYSPEGELLCSGGHWTGSGACLLQGAQSRVARAVRIVLRLGSLSGISAAWARENHETLVCAVAGFLGVDASTVQVEILSSAEASSANGAAGRRLASGPGGRPQRQHVRVRGAAGRRLLLPPLVSAPQKPTRRLQEDQQEDVELLITLILEEGAPLQSPTELMAKLLGSNSSDSSGGLAAALVAELERQGLTVPQGLTVGAIGEAVVIDGLVVPVVQWLAGNWGGCSGVCGEGVELRSVLCSMGSEVACSSTASGAGTRPQEQQACEAYIDCPFQLTCPLGPGGSLSCGAQAGLFAGVLVVVTCCCACLALRCLLRPKLKGKVTLEFQDKPAEYHIIRPAPANLPTRGSSVATLLSRHATLSRHSAEEQTSTDGKTHIIWDLDMPQVEQYFARQGTSITVGGGAASGEGDAEELEQDDGESIDLRLEGQLAKCIDSIMAGQHPALVGAAAEGSSSPSRARCAASPRNSSWGRSIRSATALVVHTAYVDGDQVEYYSKTHQCWLLGTMSVAFPAMSSGAARYDVSIGSTGQPRRDVPLDLLRPPLQQDEPVEVWSRSRRRWVPATISGPQSASATTVGYHVLLSGASVPLANTPAARLRRLYRPGDAVQAAADSAAQGLRRAVSRSRLDSASSAETEDSPAADASPAPSTVPSLPATSAADPWAWVLALAEDVTGQEQRQVGSSSTGPEWFPTFLLRR